MRLYHYTPMLATRDEIAKLAAGAIRRVKGGQSNHQVTLRRPGGTLLATSMDASLVIGGFRHHMLGRRFISIQAVY
jgi:hypothetical protein